MFKKQKGFTLIELLVVIAILGILAAVVVPNVIRFIGEGEEESAQTELANVQLAVTAVMAAPDPPISNLATDARVDDFNDGIGEATRNMRAAAFGGFDPMIEIDGADGSPVGQFLLQDETEYLYAVDSTGRTSGWYDSNGDGAADEDGDGGNELPI